MSNCFTTPDWDSNHLGDQTCQDLFKKNKSQFHHNAFNNTVQNGNRKNKIRKRKILNKEKTKLNDEIKTINTNQLQKAKQKEILQRKLIKIENKNIHKTCVNSGRKLKNKSRNKQQKSKLDIDFPKDKICTNGQKVENTHTTKNKIQSKSDLLNEKAKSKLLKLKQNIQTNITHNKVTEQNTTLRGKMMARLKAAHFRLLNEQIYTNKGDNAKAYFKTNKDAFKIYHDGFRQQVAKWPINPLDIIIKAVKTMPSSHTIVDMGCGEARLSKSVPQTVHSFDLVASNSVVTACDMAHVPLDSCSVNVVVFCLSLMGTNLNDYILEANRILKIGGIMKLAEVESRFDDIDKFIEGVQQFGFQKIMRDVSHNLFYFVDFKKDKNTSSNKKLPKISLLPCLYKKR